MSEAAIWPVFFIYLTVGHVQTSASVNFTVIGPSRPIVAALCGDVEMPCQLSPGVSAKAMEVRCTRPPSHAPVHLYRNGTDDKKQQSPQYHGRTELIKDNITEGAVALKIHNITASDAGQYQCQFQSTNFTVGANLKLDIKAKSPCELQRELEKLKDANTKSPCELQRELEKLKDANRELSSKAERNMRELAWRKGRINEEKVILDPETAHPQLIVSADGKSVRFGDTKQNVTDSPKRFTSHPCVLGSVGYSYSDMKHSWEVDVGHVGDWSVGAVPASVDRKGDRMMTPETHFWAVYMVENPGPTMTPRPRQMGVYLDSRRRELSIYNAETRALIWSFFLPQEEIFPLFCLFGSAELKL